MEASASWIPSSGAGASASAWGRSSWGGASGFRGTGAALSPLRNGERGAGAGPPGKTFRGFSWSGLLLGTSGRSARVVVPAAVGQTKAANWPPCRRDGRQAPNWPLSTSLLTTPSAAMYPLS